MLINLMDGGGSGLMITQSDNVRESLIAPDDTFVLRYDASNRQKNIVCCPTYLAKGTGLLKVKIECEVKGKLLDSQTLPFSNNNTRMLAYFGMVDVFKTVNAGTPTSRTPHNMLEYNANIFNQIRGDEVTVGYQDVNAIYKDIDTSLALPLQARDFTLSDTHVHVLRVTQGDAFCIYAKPAPIESGGNFSDIFEYVDLKVTKAEICYDFV
ncbi:MAG: hypothetical protein PHW03_05945 [Eubacteriales bacterium]|nr:hypothetical protein [Eubacteriales bacterium]